MKIGRSRERGIICNPSQNVPNVLWYKYKMYQENQRSSTEYVVPQQPCYALTGPSVDQGTCNNYSFSNPKPVPSTLQPSPSARHHKATAIVDITLKKAKQRFIQEVQNQAVKEVIPRAGLQ